MAAATLATAWWTKATLDLRPLGNTPRHILCGVRWPPTCLVRPVIADWQLRGQKCEHRNNGPEPFTVCRRPSGPGVAAARRPARPTRPPDPPTPGRDRAAVSIRGSRPRRLWRLPIPPFPARGRAPADPVSPYPSVSSASSYRVPGKGFNAGRSICSNSVRRLTPTTFIVRRPIAFVPSSPKASALPVTGFKTA